MKLSTWILSILIALSFFSCEEDDICIDEKTPQLVIRLEPFNDNSSLDSIIIRRLGIDDAYSLVSQNALSDSVKVALRLDDVTQTKLIISNSTYDATQADTLTLDYSRDLIFGSKACGYKLNYLDINYSISGDLFVEDSIIQNQITNENLAHLLLYY